MSREKPPICRIPTGPPSVCAAQTNPNIHEMICKAVPRHWKSWMQRLIAIVVAATAAAALAQAQQQTLVKVDGKDYAVTEFSRGRMLQFTDTTNGQSAMVSVQGNNYTVLSPPGGYFNGVDYNPVIKKAFDAYEALKSGTANSNAPAGSSSTDQNAALRQQSDAAAALAQQRASEAGTPASEKPPTLDHLTADGAVINDSKLGLVTIKDNGMTVTWTQSGRGMAANADFTADFEGGATQAGAGKKTAKVFKGLGTAVGDSMNPRANAASSITANTDVWEVKEHEGNNTTKVYESGGYRTGGYIAATGRDPGGQIGASTLYSVLQDLNLAKDQIAAAQAKGQTIAFDATSNRFQRGYKALQDATKDFGPR